MPKSLLEWFWEDTGLLKPENLFSAFTETSLP